MGVSYLNDYMSNFQLQKIISIYTIFAFSPALLMYCFYGLFGWIIFPLTLNPFLGYVLIAGAYGLWSLYSLINSIKNLTILTKPIKVKIGLFLGGCIFPLVIYSINLNELKLEELLFIYTIFTPIVATIHLLFLYNKILVQKGS